MYRNGSCKKFEYPSPVSINPLQVLKIGYETGKIVFIQAKGYQSWVFYQFDIKVLKQVALVDSMRSSSESFHFFFRRFFKCSFDSTSIWCNATGAWCFTKKGETFAGCPSG